MLEPIYGIIYMTTNLINGRMYIGKHECSEPCPDDGYLGSGKALKNAIAKHGKDNFKRRTLHVAYSLEELNMLEKRTIAEYNAVKDKRFYNIATGGDGGNDEQLAAGRKEYYQNASDEEIYRKTHTDKCMAHYENVKGSVKINSRCKRFICNQNNKIYQTTPEAAKDLGIENCVSHIRECLKGKILSVKGYTFEYIDEPSRKRNDGRGWRTTYCYCVELDYKEMKLSEASELCYGNKKQTTAIKNAIDNPDKDCRGYHFISNK